jgi:hypothetical protein
MNAVHLSINRIWFIDKITGPLFLKEWLSSIPTPVEETTLILSVWTESYIIQQYHPTFMSLSNYNFKKIYLICDRSMQLDPTFSTYKFPDNIEVKFLNLWGFFVQQHSELQNNWNRRANLGLLLTGKLYRQNRFGLLKVLYDAGLLDTIMWSFPEPQAQYALIKKLSDEQGYTNFEEVFDYCQSHALTDATHVIRVHNQKFGVEALDITYPQTYYNKNVWCPQFYASSNYSIISESEFKNSMVRCTEKTYRTIYNKHPFIMAASPGTLALLNTLGFKTFTEFLPRPDYDNIQDNNLRLDAIVENIKAFPSILTLHQDSINADVEHNFTLLSTSISNDKQAVLEWYTSLGIDHSLFADNFEMTETNGIKMTVEELLKLKQQEQEFLKMLHLSE